MVCTLWMDVCMATGCYVQSRLPGDRHRPCAGLLAGQTRRASNTQATTKRAGFAKIPVARPELFSSLSCRVLENRRFKPVITMQELFRFVLLMPTILVAIGTC
jgi:hypothetical protein